MIYEEYDALLKERSGKNQCRCVANSTVSGYPPIIIHRLPITGSSLELHSLSILDPWVGRGHGHKMLRPQSSTSCSHTLSYRQAQAFLSLSRSPFPLTVCARSTYNPFSPPVSLVFLRRWTKKPHGNPTPRGPVHYRISSGFHSIRDRIARLSFGRLGSFLILGRGGIRRAESGAAAAAADVFLVNLCS